jgi:hypothetical protein
MKFPLLIALLLCSIHALAQEKERQVLDSLLQTPANLDTLGHFGKIDSLKASFQGEGDSLKQVYQEKISRVQQTQQTFQNKVDSLNHLQLPTEKYTHKLDSVQQKTLGLTQEYEQKVKSLQSKYLQKINSLELPPEASAELKKATQFVDQYQLPSLSAGKIPGIDLPKLDLPNAGINTTQIGNVNLPDTNIPGTEGLQTITGKTGELGKATGELGQVQQQVGEVTSGVKDVNSASKVLEQKAGDMSGVQKALGDTKGLGNVGALPTEEAAKSQIEQQVKTQATEVARDHFAGKEQVLQQAMETLAKYKKKYGSLNSLNDLPKKRPNEMRGKPLIERVVPGVAFQVQKQEAVLVDVNPYLAYRITGRLSAGGGWNQRVAYNRHHKHHSNEGRIYGPRVFAEFNLWKGIYPRLEGEVMNTYVPPLLKNITTDAGHRTWVYGAMAGIKKDYRIAGHVKGTAMMMLRLFNPQHKSPYVDVLNVRFGFEFPMKKKVKQEKKNSQ